MVSEPCGGSICPFMAMALTSGSPPRRCPPSWGGSRVRSRGTSCADAPG